LRGTIAPLVGVQMLSALGESFSRAFFVCFGIILVGVVLQTLSMHSYRAKQRSETP